MENAMSVKKTTPAKAIDELVRASLNVQDEQLTDEQRGIAEQIYELASRLEATLESSQHYTSRE
jgi:hypothetical protein